MSGLLTEEWLAKSGFKYYQEELQPQKHWQLWLGWGNDQNKSCQDDIGIELSMAWWLNRNQEKVGDTKGWHCWIISHSGSRKIIHVRLLYRIEELTKLVEALTGQEWNAENHHFGNCYSKDKVDRLKLNSVP